MKPLFWSETLETPGRRAGGVTSDAGLRNRQLDAAYQDVVEKRHISFTAAKFFDEKAGPPEKVEE